MIRLLLTTLFCALIINAEAQQKQQAAQKFFTCPAVSTEQLQAMSDEMYAAGNYKYIWVDLWKDGYVRPEDDNLLHNSIGLDLKEGKESLIVFEDKLPEDVAKKYAAKFRDFVASVKGDPKMRHYWIQRVDFNAQTVTDPASSFWKLTIKDVMNMIYYTDAETEIYREMVKDGFGGEDRKIMFIQCSQISLVVNHKDVEGALYEKYKKLFKDKLGIAIDFPFNRYQTQFMQFDDEHMKAMRVFRTGSSE